MLSTRVTKPPANAVALTAFRPMPDGTGRQYTATTFPRDPWQGCEMYIRRAGCIGFLTPSSADPDSGYAVLDVLDDVGDIVADYEIPTARAFKWWYRTMGWRVEATDGDARE